MNKIIKTFPRRRACFAVFSLTPSPDPLSTELKTEQLTKWFKSRGEAVAKWRQGAAKGETAHVAARDFLEHADGQLQHIPDKPEEKKP